MTQTGDVACASCSSRGEFWEAGAYRGSVRPTGGSHKTRVGNCCLVTNDSAGAVQQYETYIHRDISATQPSPPSLAALSANLCIRGVDRCQRR